MKKDIIPESWGELQEVLFHNTWDERINRYRSPYAYRGMANKDHQLMTSLMRMGGDYVKLEKHLLRNFRKYSLKNTVPLKRDSTWEWLSLAQHHGLPTRLLDWTYSPYVALHFATAEITEFDNDGVIWCVNFMELNELLPFRLKEVIEEEGSNIFTVEMLSKICGDLNELEEYSYKKEDFVLFMEPPSIDEWIINQYALFSMMSKPNGLLSEWLTARPEYYFRIIIPRALKREIRDKLDQANINERTIFPGLDGLSAWLKRHYSLIE